MDLRVGGIVIRFGDGVRIGRRLQIAAPPATACPESDKRDDNEAARANFQACADGACHGARFHEAAPVGRANIPKRGAEARGVQKTALGGRSGGKRFRGRACNEKVRSALFYRAVLSIRLSWNVAGAGADSEGVYSDS